MNKRKQKIIDKRFQLQTTFSVIGVFFSITCLFIIIIGINVYNDNKKIERIIKEQKSIINAQNEINNIMLENLIIRDDESIINLRLKEKCSNNIISMNNNMEELKDLTQRNNIIFLIIIIFLISVGIILYPILIRKTHKISGPIFIMSKYIKDIIKGKDPDLRPLRKNDELKEFYELFSQLVAFIKKDNSLLK